MRSGHVNVKRLIKQLLCDDPYLTVDDLQRTLRDDFGVKLSGIAIGTIRGDFFDTVRILVNMGVMVPLEQSVTPSLSDDELRRYKPKPEKKKRFKKWWFNG